MLHAFAIGVGVGLVVCGAFLIHPGLGLITLGALILGWYQ